MLSRFAAVLSTSTVVLCTVGGLVLPGNGGAGEAAGQGSAGSTGVATVAAVPAAYVLGDLISGIPNPYIGPEPAAGRAPVDTLARLRGVALLEQLSMLDRSDLAAFTASHPDKIAELVSSPPAPADVATWWGLATGPARTALLQEAPGLIGNLEGVPFELRDSANRLSLQRTVADIRAQLDAGVGRAAATELETRLGMLQEVATALETGESGALRSLVSLDVSGEGRAVVAVGDLDEAEYVTYLVPGMYFGVASQLVDWTATAERLATGQQEWLDRLGDGGDVATVAWIGYRTPTLLNASQMDTAEEGRDALTGTLQGLVAERERRGGDAPFVSIVAHSYGSTAAMMALQENDVTVDALVMVGSPGSPAQTVADLKVRGGNVWVGAAEWDPIPRSGVYGSQPLSPSFGANILSTEAAFDPLSGVELEASASHNDYFTSTTTTMRNMGLITIGRADLVIGAEGGPTLALGKALARG